MIRAALPQFDLDVLRSRLEVDQVLSFGQVRRHLGIELTPGLASASGLVAGKVIIETATGSPSSMAVVDVVTSWSRSRLMRTHEWRSAHLAGAAEVRYLLSRLEFSPPAARALEIAGLEVSDDERQRLLVGSGAWMSEAHAVGATERPDALWSRLDGSVVAIEYDSGSYRPPVIASKLKVFSEEYARIVWACSSQRRQISLRRRFPREVPVLLAEWWR